MKVFQCSNCNHPLFFENHTCKNCGYLCGYRGLDRKMLSFDPSSLTLKSTAENKEYKYCKNKEYEVCNWLIEKENSDRYCSACQLNRTIPNLSEEKNFSRWKNLEIAKHRLVYQLQKIGLILPSKLKNENGLCFDFIAKQNNPKIMTGHYNGVITILLMEADSVLREQIRQQLDEPYRTLIGHLRHEVGHYFWERLVFSNPEVLLEFRTVFGHEENYGSALKKYYLQGAPLNWRESYISKYATSHPWEDWAETWAHYMHVMDMVETSHFFGLKVNPTDILKGMKSEETFDPYMEDDFETIIHTCVPLSYAVNSINRAMGIPDVYPFEISPTIVQKMKFIHNLLLPKRKLI